MTLVWHIVRDLGGFLLTSVLVVVGYRDATKTDEQRRALYREYQLTYPRPDRWAFLDRGRAGDWLRTTRWAPWVVLATLIPLAILLLLAVIADVMTVLT